MTSDEWKVIRGLFIWLDPDDWVHSRALAKAKAQELVHNEAEWPNLTAAARRAGMTGQSSWYECIGCGSRNCRWHLAWRVSDGGQDGRLYSYDIVPIAHLACEECGETIRTADKVAVNKMLNIVTTGKDMAQTTGHECANCGSHNCRWHLALRVHNEAEDGRLRMHDVAPIAHLACEECGETIRTVDEFEIDRMLN